MELFELTHSQRNLLFMEQFNPGTSLGVIAGTVTLERNNIDVKLLEQAINLVIQTNDALRLQFIEKNGTFYQYCKEYEFYPVEVIDFSNENKKVLYDWEESQAKIPFNLIDSPLYSFSIMKNIDSVAFYIKTHHLVSDGWTMSLIANQVMENYCKLESGEEVVCNSYPSYLDYIIDEREYNKSNKLNKSREYWLSKFENGFESAKLKSITSNRIGTSASRSSYVLPEKLSKLLYEYSKQNRVSIFSIFISAISMYINRVTSKEDFNFGTLILNRANSKEKNTLGMFVNTVPIKVKINKNDNLLDFSKKISTEMIGILKNQKYPYDYLKKDLREKFSTEESLIDIILSYQNSKLISNETIQHKARWHFNGHQTHSLTIDLNDRESEGNLIVSYDYLNAVFNKKEIEFMHDHIVRLLWHALDNPLKPLCKLEMVSQSEKNRILNEFNNTDVEYLKDKTLDMIFDEQVRKTPNNIAVETETDKLTYKELFDRSEKLATELRQNGVMPDDIVGIKMYRSLEMIIAILGVHKAGAAYMPIDPDYPIDRVEYMLNDSKSKVLLSTSDIDNSNVDVKIILVSEKDLRERDLILSDKIHNSRNLAYIIYTSGSTGKPKGVMIEHHSAINRISWMQKKYNLDEKDVILQKTPYTFDVSVWELVWWYFVGAKVFMLEPGAQKFPDKIIDTIYRYNITTMHFVPSMLNAFLEYIDMSSETNKLRTIKRVFASGEALTIEQVKKYNKLVYSINNAHLINLYGPTEATVDVSYFDCSPTPENGIVPIGKSIDNTQLYVLDTDLNLLPIGIPGELYIAGVQLARGYINNPKLTAEKFIDNPFRPGEKMYKTGDLTRWMPQGDIEYLGRIDFQIKIRGFRIEIGEIETQIKNFKTIQSSVVTVATDEKSGLKNLCAYFVAKEKIDIKKLKLFLESKLPEYMVPAYYMQLENMPLSANGKLDRKQLPKIEQADIETIIIKPQTDEQQILADVFKEILNIKEIGINQNIFELGVDSLKAIGALTRIFKYNWNIGIQDFYKYPTIEQLANKITNKVEQEVEVDVSNICKLPAQEVITSISGTKLKSENVLLTGATGFLGIHILQKLLETTNSNVYCLIRSNNCINRLKELLSFYFENKYVELIDKRIFVVNGDVSLDKLGLDDKLYNELGEKIDIIIHSAAMVKYYGEYDDIRKVNVIGTQNMINFALTYGIKLNHISTDAITGDYLIKNDLPNMVFTENNFYVGQKYWENIYVRSKFEAENEIIGASEKGLNYTIYRMGNLTGRYSDGQFQKNIDENAFYGALKTIFGLGYVSETLKNEKVEFTPVDLAATTIIKTFNICETNNRVLHITNNNTITVKDLIDILSELKIDVKLLSEEEIRNLSVEYSIDGASQIYINKEGKLNCVPTFEFNANLTCDLLKLLDFEWNVIDKEYINKILSYMKTKEFIF